MFWRKRREKASQAAPVYDPSRHHEVDLAAKMVTFSLPEGTRVDAFGQTVGELTLPGAKNGLLYSASSYDLDRFDLRSVRPAEAALGEGEFLSDAPDGEAQDDYARIIKVEADEGPYAEHGGYLMRLSLFQGQLLRALRFAVIDQGDLDRARELLENARFAAEATPVDDRQSSPDTAIIHIGSYFQMVGPPDWAVYPMEEDEGDDDENTDRVVCVSPDEEAFAQVIVNHGYFGETRLPPEAIDDALDAHLDAVSPRIEATLNSPAVILARTPESSLVAGQDPRRDEAGQFQQSYSLQSMAPNHMVHVEIQLNTVAENPMDAAWQSIIDAFEPCVRAILIHHPEEFVVGEKR